MFKKRKQIEDNTLNVLKLWDPSGVNAEKYREFFRSMNDEEFTKWANEFFKNDDEQYHVEVEAYEYEPTIETCELAEEYMGESLYQYVALPFDGVDEDGNVAVTPYPVPIGYIHMKRTQQMVAKKNTMSLHADSRDAKTGQVIGDDKNGVMSDMENISLIATGLDKTVEEFGHARSDNMKAKAKMLEKIQNDGYVKLSDLGNKTVDRTAINTLDVYLLSAGIKSNLITNGLVLKSTLKMKGERKESEAERLTHKDI